MKKMYFMLLCAALALVGCSNGSEPHVTTIDSFCGTFTFTGTNQNGDPITGTVISTFVDSFNVSLDMSGVSSNFTKPLMGGFVPSYGKLYIAPATLDSTTGSPKLDVKFQLTNQSGEVDNYIRLILNEPQKHKITIDAASAAKGFILYSNESAKLSPMGDGTLLKVNGFNLEKQP